VRWIQVPEHQSISWSVEPHKRSINFAIFKHPGIKGGLTPVLPTQEEVGAASESVPPTPGLDGAAVSAKRGRHGSISKSDAASAAREKLESIGIKTVAWTGRCEADKVTMGRYEVQEGQGGMYGMVFDNTFSKQTSKTVHFVLMTHPTDAPPKSGHHLHYSQASDAKSTGAMSKSYSPVNDSTESLPQTGASHRAVLEDPRPASRNGRAVETKGPEGSSFYTGVLHKKRRKKGQGWAKRFFSLDFTSSTLSYYRDRHSSALRGAVPLSLAAVGVSEKTREFSIDSGAEVWHIKAFKKDFEGWRNALERASATVNTTSAPATPAKALGGLPKLNAPNPAEDREWERVEQLVSKVSGTRDAVRALAKDTDPKYLSGVNGVGLALTQSGGSSNAPSPSSYESANPYFPETDDRGQDKRPSFWKRKTSAERSPAALFRRSVSAQLAVPSPSLAPLSPVPGMPPTIRKRPSFLQQQLALPEEDVHERCMALLRDLDDVVAEFSGLVAESKARRHPALPTSSSRMSLDSIDQEFFDADDGVMSPSQLLRIRQSEDEDVQDGKMFEGATEADSDTSSEANEPGDESVMMPRTAQNALFPGKPQALSPLPLQPVPRRTTIRPPKQAPPSIIGFLRKNAGKDLSTVSMPVTANEPTSLLQRLAESIEYSQLLDSAASALLQPAERLMYVTAFAISYFANNRVKERAIRKPFNPMLGETYELVREDLGFRFLAEKVSHHPVRMACQAESLANGGWSFVQSPQPVQKFWGKSVELNTEGRARVVLHGPNEHYSWNQATCFLRNVIAGEKYVEPVQSMTVTCETTGMRAAATFKAGGMFSGRSEEVDVQLFDTTTTGEQPLPPGLTGKWTENLKRTDTGASIWAVGSLVADAPKVYGLTTFAAALNEISPIEEGKLGPTDSRLRPDQQALEAGDIDKAEGLKARLEERQRARRKVLESHGQSYKPQFFEKVAGGDGEENGVSEEVWMLKSGNDGYWERRARGQWDGVQEVFEL